MKISHNVTTKRLADILCTALEGGMCNQWIEVINPKPGKTLVHPWGADQYTPNYIEAPFSGSLDIKVSDEGDGDERAGKTYRLTLAKMKKGAQVMAEKFPSHWGDFMAENDDAITGDVFLQCCIFGDVIYG